MFQLEAIDLSAPAGEAVFFEPVAAGKESCALSFTLGQAATAPDPQRTRPLVRRARGIGTTEPAQLEPGSILGHYRIVGRVGSGGMGEVYAAVDRRLGRRVALKILSAGAQRRAGDAGTAWGLRFSREGRALASLQHPNVVTLYSAEEAGGRRFFTMEWVDGVTLADREAIRPPLALDRFLGIAVPLADALAAVHARGIAHRDLKPANVMIDRDGRLKLLDFGLACWSAGDPDFLQGSGGPADLDPRDLERTGLLPLTGTGQLLGTPAYMAPEQLRGREVDARTDVFAAGVLSYELLTGERPFRGATSTEMAAAILRDDPPPVGSLRCELPASLGRIVERCLCKEPSGRFRDGAELRDALVAVDRPAATVA